jgi:hypothetical protein
MDQLMPWYSPGLFPTRTWVYSPSAEALKLRWQALMGEPDLSKRHAALKQTRDSNPDRQYSDLPGFEHNEPLPPINTLKSDAPIEAIVTVGYRAFDRQKPIADPRLMDMPRHTLWAAASQVGQVFVVEQHRQPLRPGPGLVFSGFLPDYHHFKGSEGGRTLPFLHPNGSANLASGLLDALSSALGVQVTSAEVLAYIAAVTSHPAYTATFSAELETPGIHVPITADANLWCQAVELGRNVLWAHTLGRAFADDSHPQDSVTFPKDEPERVTNTESVKQLPEGFSYDPDAQELELGGGRFGPVTPETFAYEVGGRNVLKSWIDYRSKEPAGKRTSPLDDINPPAWEHEWTGELIEVLSVLRRLVDLEPAQAELLRRVLAAPLMTIRDLSAAGVSWPTSDADRKPRYPLTGPLFDA